MLDKPAQDRTAKIMALVTRIAGQHEVVRAIEVTDHLVDAGMTSMAMVDLMLAIEAEFDVTIPQRELTPTNFQSIESLARMIDRVCGDG